MNDLTLTRDSDRMVVKIETETADGADFIEAYYMLDDSVFDSQRRVFVVGTILPETAEADLLVAAREHGLTCQASQRTISPSLMASRGTF
jgi:hypothetical protein